MSILDDAIREHLELKRAHGADATELKKLEDEAFGPPARPDEPDPLAEAPTEFLTPEGAEAAAAPGGRRVPNIADLQEAPEPRKEEEPQAEEQPIPAPEPEASHSTGEREAIAEQPTEHFDVEAEMVSDGQAASPSDEELIDAEISEPRLSPVEPELDEDEEDDDFFSEQRLSDELSQALDTPIEGEPEMPKTDEHAAPPVEEARPLEEVEHDEAEEYEEDDEPRPAASDEDVLEGTPEFLEDTPEDDDLWFEQRPPKDFDFDD
ncbi:MAG: hypothetical protein WBL45_12740 [Solirubrobacterales bacterium]